MSETMTISQEENALPKKMTVSQEEAVLTEKLAKLRRTRRARELIEALDAGFLPQGTRLVDPANTEEGRVFVFAPDEAGALTTALRAIAAARLARK